MHRVEQLSKILAPQKTMNLLRLIWGIFLFEIGFYGLGVRSSTNKSILCYFNSWAIARPGNKEHNFSTLMEILI